MKIVVLTGSPRKHGTSTLLASEFIRGAEEAGHTVFRFDCAFQKVHPCIACDKCRTTDEGCVWKDDMEILNPHLLEADAVVLVSPIYYYDWNAQLKTVIDRFYANSEALRAPKDTALMLTMADDTMESADGAILSYRNMMGFMNWKDRGVIAARDCWERADIEKSQYPALAYELGKNW